MRGSIIKRGKTYSIVMDIGRDENGKRKQRWESGFKTKKEAEKALNEALTRIERGEFFEASKMTLKEYLLYWQETYAKVNVAPSTFKRYIIFINDINEYLGKIQLNQLKPSHIQQFYTILIEEGKKSKSTILKTHRLLHLALKHAVKWQMIPNNATDAVTPPKSDEVEMHIWDAATANRFLQEITDTSIFIPVLLALQTGMREGEICGLKWDDVDLINGSLSVKYTLQRINGQLILKEPKTKKSRRSLALMDMTIKELKNLRKQQLQLKLLLGEEYVDQNYVCAWNNGNPYDPHFVGSKFAKIIKKLNYPTIRFHDLRHTHATLLLQQGINPKIVSERLGHSQISITLDTYSHVLPNMQKDAVNKLNDLFI